MKKKYFIILIVCFLWVIYSCNNRKNILTTQYDNIAVVVPKSCQPVKPEIEDRVRAKYHYPRFNEDDIVLFKDKIFVRVATNKSIGSQNFIKQCISSFRLRKIYKYIKSFEGKSNGINYTTFVYSFYEDTIVNRRYHTDTYVSDNLTYVHIYLEYERQDSAKAMKLHNYIVKHFKKNKNSAILDTAFLIKHREYKKMKDGFK